MSEKKPWEMDWSIQSQNQSDKSNKNPWEMDWDKGQISPPQEKKEQDGALTRGWTKAKNSMAISADLATGDTASAAQKVKEADDYSKANPGSKEGKVLMDAWDRGDGITGGISEVVGQIKKNAEKTDGIIGGVRSVGKDLQAMGSGLLEQTPNMIAPMTGMAAGAKAGSMAGGAIGAVFGGVGAAPGAAIGGVVGSVAGGAAGNTAIEGGYHLLDSVQKAGINPQDTKAVQAFIEKNGDKVFDEAATKGLILGAVDAATWKMGRFFLDAPAKAATSRALTEMGVDAADKAAVKTAMQSNDFAQRIAADTAYQTSLKGAENVARNTAAFATEPAGEFSGEYFGSGIAYDDWDTKNAALEAISSLGQSGVMYTGQKAFQYLSRPKSLSVEQLNATSQEQQRITDENQAKELQKIAEQQQKIFGFGKDQPAANYNADDIYAKTGIPPSPIIDESKFTSDPLRYENGIDYAQPQINTDQNHSGLTQHNNENSIEYTPQSQHENWSINSENPQNYDNSIEFESQKPSDLESKVQFNDLYGQSAPDPQIDYSALSPFMAIQEPIVNQQRLSEQLGINPDDGPMSSAAALAVDTGVSSQMQQAAAAAAQNENNNSPLTTAAGLLNGPEQTTGSNQQRTEGPDSSNQSGLGESNTSATGNDATTRQGNALELNAPASAVNGNVSNNSTNLEPSGNQTGISQPGTNDGGNAKTGGDPGTTAYGNREAETETSRQQDLHHVNAIGDQSTVSGISGTEEQTNTGTDGKRQGTSQGRTVEPILGADGKNKWFGSQEKAKAFLDKKNLGNDYQVVQDGKRFEIQPKSQVAQNQNDNLNNQNSILNSQNTSLDAQNNTDKSQTSGIADQLAQLEQNFNAIKGNSVKQAIEKSKIKKQIDQLKSQQPEMTTAPFGSEQIQKQYGDTAESVMSDIEILGDDFTIDLRDKNKKTNALNNPNYNAVQKADGSVEIVGMKHPSTGEWIGKKPNAISIDENAHQAATSSQNNTPEPTQAQIEAGNYKKGHIKVHGLDIAIENPRGSERRGTDPDGNEWSHTMSDHYGYIKRSIGADREQIDTYIGNNPDSNQVFIVDQVDQKSGNFDEHKVMLGFDSQEEAATAYKSNFDKGWKVGPIRNMDMEQFKDWLKNEDTSKPAIQKNVKDSIENIRAEKIRQKDLADMHNSVYGLATDEQLQESLKHLNKEIKKAQKQSENEVANGKRSTRKAVAAGALDRFLKDRVDLETYIKARKNGELKQRNKKIDDYSRDKLKPDNERKGVSPLDTTFIPLSVVSATRRVLSILHHLKLSATQDASSGRLFVGSRQGGGVDKVKGLDSHSFTIQVVESFDGLPSAIQQDATYQDENGNTQNYDVSGVWHNGTLYVVADQVYGDSGKQLTTFDAYEELLTHEIVGHFGVQQIFGQEYKTKLQQLYNALGELEGIRKIASKNGVNMAQFESAYIEPYTQGAKEGIYAESDVQQALVGELFAFVAQNAKSRPFVRQKLKEVLGYIRQWFRDRGFDKFLSRYNDADLMMFLAEARKAVVDQSYFGKYKDQKIETKQDSNIPQYSRNIKSKSPIAIQSDSEIGQTHLIPNHLLDSAHRLGDVVNDLASMRTEGVKANVPYAIKLLRNIAKLNPNVKIHIVSDLNNIQDKAIRAGLADGGFFVPEKNTSYIYPKSEAWESTVLELINHELVHTVTEYSLSHGVVSNQLLNELQQIREQIDAYRWENPEGLSENVKNRFAYLIGTNPDHETLAVGIAESEVRQVLKSIIGESGLSQLDAIYNEISSNQVEQNEQRKQGKNTGNGKSTGNGNLSETESRAAERSRGLSEKTGSSQQYDGSTRTDQTDLSTGEKQQGLINNDSGVSITEENKVELASDKHNQGGNLSGNKSSEPASTIDAKLSEIEYQEKPLYSRRTKSNSGSTTQQVRDVLIDRFGKETIDELERQGKLEIIQDYQVEGVEGFYYNGKAVLVASNLTAESTVPTFLHELGGHAGFQNMMNQKQYDELMNQFNKLVEQGNPVAMAAKVLAEREQGSERQQLEYLPYLLTLSATMQQRNVLQRNALQKLINNIVSYVKAWVFDNFGINLNLNPDDMLALSERMIGQIKHQSSLDLIRQKYHGTNQWMTAPNGAKTHLSEQQWLQVRTPEFKKWFGDWENDAANASQVLDENGEPKVVYHGTATEFNEFKQGHGLLGDGIYLTDSFDTADVYANIRGENGFVLPLFVNIRNAFKTTGNVSRDEFVEATTSGKYQGIVHQFENQEYIVALEPNQVKMAEGNKGTFNSESSDIRFSRSAKDIIDNLSKNLGNISISSVKDKTGYKFTDWLGIGLSALGRRQLTEIYSKILPQLNKYNELAAQMDADKNDAGAEADSIVREWANLKDENELADLMHDATLAKIDPAKPYVPGDNHIKYQQLRQSFNALSPEAQDMYVKARDAYKKHYAKVQSAIKDRILRASLSSQKKADLIKQMDDQFYGYVKGVYFPLARFGKYVVVVRNQNGDVESVSRAETMGEAQKIRSEMLKKFPQWKVEPVIQDKEFRSARDAVGRGFMSSLFDEVANLGLSSTEQASFEDTLNQLYLSSMPDLSWAKHGIHRKGTAGFSNDARRAFAQHMFSGANYLAKLRYGDQLADQLDAMQKYADDQIKQNHQYNQSTAQSVIDEMNKRHENLMNPKGHPLSSALTSLGFIYYLGLSPAAAMVNLSQTALVAYPLMGAKWDFDKAGKELLKASNDFRKGVEFHKVKWQGTKTDLYKAVSSDISKFLNKDEQAAYQKAVDSGVIDVTQAHDLAGIAQGEDSGVMWKTRPIMRAASVMFHSAERFNREVTFIASYRLARQAGANHDDAYKQADKMTYDSQYDYGSGNRPRIMQGNVAKVLLLFKQFGQNMVYTLARQTYQSIKGETKEERREARRAISAILAMHATFAGALGLPMVGMLLSVASWMGGDDDDPWDAEVALRNYLAEAFNPTISNMLMKGAPRGIGVDISGRVGINNLLLPDVQEGLEGKKWWDSASAAVLGPIGGIGANIAKGAQEISEGHNLRGVESMLPVFLKNFAKTYRYADEGVQDKTGVSIMDEVSSMDLLVQGMGFSPSDVRTASEGKTAIYQLNRKLNERRSRLMALWSRAKMMDDQQEMDEIWEQIQGFNDKNPSRRITRMNLNQSYRNRQRRIDRAEDGIYLSRNRQDAREAGYFAFGE